MRKKKNLLAQTLVIPAVLVAAGCAGDNTGEPYDGSLTKNLEPLHVLDYSARSVAFSPDGRSVAVGLSAYAVEPVTLYDVDSGESLGVLSGHDDWTISIVFSPDGKTIATGSRDGSVKIWDAATQEERMTVGEYTMVSYVQAVSPDGRTLYTTGTGVDGGPHLWNLADGNAKGQMNEATTCGWQVSLDGKSLVGCRDDGGVIWFDLNSASLASSLDTGDLVVDKVIFGADGRRMLTALEGRVFRLWDLETQTQLVEFTDTLSGENIYQNIYLSGDGAKVMIDEATPVEIGYTRHVYAFDVDSSDGRVMVSDVSETALSADGNTLVVGFDDGTLQLFDVNTEETIRSYNAHTDIVSDIVVNPNGSSLVTSSWDDTTIIWAE